MKNGGLRVEIQHGTDISGGRKVSIGLPFYGLLFEGIYIILDRKFIRSNFKWE